MAIAKRLIQLGVPVEVAKELEEQIISGGIMPDAANSENQLKLIELIGNLSDPAWNFSSPNSSIIALLKAIANNTRST